MTHRQSKKLVEDLLTSLAADSDNNTDCDSLVDADYEPDSEDNSTSTGSL